MQKVFDPDKKCKEHYYNCAICKFPVKVREAWWDIKIKKQVHKECLTK
jgi:ribosomal protein L37E